MKRNLNYLMTALLALAGLALFNTTAKATIYGFNDNDPTYTPDDLYLVVQDPIDGSAKNYALDLGSYSNFTSVAAGQTITLVNAANLNSDLNKVFAGASGSGTWQGSAAEFEIFGQDLAGGSTNGTEFTTAQPGTGQAYINAYNNVGSARLIASNSFKGVVNNLNSNDYNVTLGSAANSIEVSSGAYQAPSTGISGDSAFGLIGDKNEDGGSLLPASLDLIEIPDTNGTRGTPQDLGTISLDAQGDLTFTAAATPEPATWAMMLGGLGFLAWMLRRKQVLA